MTSENDTQLVDLVVEYRCDELGVSDISPRPVTEVLGISCLESQDLLLWIVVRGELDFADRKSDLLWIHRLPSESIQIRRES